MEYGDRNNDSNDDDDEYDDEKDRVPFVFASCSQQE